VRQSVCWQSSIKHLILNSEHFCREMQAKSKWPIAENCMKIMQFPASGHLDFGALQQHLNFKKSIQLFAGTSVST
jgi:hypothetical protein